jgi:hypothetical protein
MKTIWKYIKIVFDSIIEAKIMRAKDALKNNNYYHM